MRYFMTRFAHLRVPTQNCVQRTPRSPRGGTTRYNLSIAHRCEPQPLCCCYACGTRMSCRGTRWDRDGGRRQGAPRVSACQRTSSLHSLARVASCCFHMHSRVAQKRVRVGSPLGCRESANGVVSKWGREESHNGWISAHQFGARVLPDTGGSRGPGLRAIDRGQALIYDKQDPVLERSGSSSSMRPPAESAEESSGPNAMMQPRPKYGPPPRQHIAAHPARQHQRQRRRG